MRAMRNIKCSDCAEYHNEWCEKIIDSPYPDMLRDCQYWHERKDMVEVIRCKDCKHYKEWESEFTPNAVVTQCMADNFPIRKAIPDGWFCAGAERRSDETDY